MSLLPQQLSAALASVALACAAVAGETRTCDFDFGWKFAVGKQRGAEARTFEDSAWQTVDLPHDWLINRPWDEKASPRRGFKAADEGWYRKRFKADPKWRGQRVLLDFEGLACWGEVFVNGRQVFVSKLTYLGFEVDVTSALDWNGENVVAVRTDTGPEGISRWYTGAGLYRSVKLVTRPPCAFARHGLYVRTETLTSAAATLAVSARLEGLDPAASNVAVVVRIFAPDGHEVSSSRGTLRDRNWIRPEAVFAPIAVASPERWSPSSPALYRLEAELRQGEAVLDRAETRFGIRTVAYGPDFGFRLNGEKLFLVGVANHHDLGGVGAAAHPRAIERYVKTLKKWGFNAIRCSHNPYSVDFLNICDREGMLVVDELTDKWNDVDGAWSGARSPFRDWFAGAVREWVTRDRNHPCVILWSLGNELQNWPDKSGFDTDDWGVTTYRVLDVLVKRWDATRPTTVALYPTAADMVNWKTMLNARDPDPPPLLCATEVASQNYRPQFYALYKQKCPSLVLFQSEASSCDLLGPAVMMDFDTSVGLAWWGVVEYWGESNRWPKKGWNYSWFSHTLEPYPQAWGVLAWRHPESPIVKLGVEVGPEDLEVWNDQKVGQRHFLSDWNRDGGEYAVTAFSNAEEVELRVNGRSFGRASVSRKRDATYGTATWAAVPYGAGGALEAVAYRGGQAVATDVIRTAGAVTRLAVEAEGRDFRADGKDLLCVNVRAVDEKGVFNPTATNEISVSVSGAARLLALDNGNHYTDRTFDGLTVPLYRGTAQIILRATRTPGDVCVRVATPGLPDATLTAACAAPAAPGE